MNNAISSDMPLPELREDLMLLEGPSNADGEPSWNIYDSVRNRYFRVGWSVFELLSRWSVGSVNKLLEKVRAETTCQLSKEDIDELLVFLYANSLTISPPGGSSRDYLERHESTKQNWLSWLVKNYLFIRIPLLKPHAFLKATLPYLNFLFSAAFRNSVIILGVVGLFLAAREWDVFINSFLYFFNLEGIALYIAALIFIKILHEFGHAYTATRYGAKVSTMGVAFLVMFPVLYTDTSNAWRLKSRKQRLHIGFAGMVVELYIACIATFAWVFMPDGALKNIAFVLATSSWLLSLSINLNIFMRFDGYYILSDWWGIENLQKKSFALGQWKLAEILFGLRKPPPENFSPRTRGKLIAYAWGTWIYRFFLFLAIALLVYHFFFKLLGVILFVIEIIYFIVMPIFKQIKTWWEEREGIASSKRSYITLSVALFFILICFIPWSETVKAPAIMQADEDVRVYAPTSAEIKSIFISEGDQVEKGQLLARLQSNALNVEIVKTEERIRSIELLLNRRAASAENLSNLHIMLSKLEEVRSEYQALQDQLKRLDIYSQISGVVVDIDDSIHERRWIDPTLPLFNIIGPHKRVMGLLDEAVVERVQLGDAAIFYPDNAQIDAVRAKVMRLGDANTKFIEKPYFNSIYGGDVATRQDGDGRYVPESAVYEVTLVMEDDIGGLNHVVKGEVHIEGEPKSIARRLLEVVSQVLIRESGF